MRTTLQTLWDWYQAENAGNVGEEEKELSELLIESEKILLANLSEEQKDALERYTEYLNKISCLIEENAFIDGIRFASAYLIDALYGR